MGYSFFVNVLLLCYAFIIFHSTRLFKGKQSESTTTTCMKCVWEHTSLFHVVFRVQNKFNLSRKYQNTHTYTHKEIHSSSFYASLFIDKKGLRSSFPFFNLFLKNRSIKHIFCSLPHLSERVHHANIISIFMK